MQLEMRSRTGSKRVAWVSYAVFRDNVQHFIERGASDGDFSTLHSIEIAVDGAQPQRVDAAQLRREVLAARDVVDGVTLQQAAVSIRTRAILTGCRQQPQVRGTAVGSVVGWAASDALGEGETIAEVVAEFVDAVLILTDDAEKGDVLVIEREGRSPWTGD